MNAKQFQQMVNRYLARWAQEDIDIAFAGHRVDTPPTSIDDGATYSSEQNTPDFLKAARGNEWVSIAQLTNTDSD